MNVRAKNGTAAVMGEAGILSFRVRPYNEHYGGNAVGLGALFWDSYLCGRKVHTTPVLFRRLAERMHRASD